MADGISFPAINDTLGKLATASDTALKTLMDGMTGEPTTAELITMQGAMQKWAFSQELTAKANERLGDLYKNIVSKS